VLTHAGRTGVRDAASGGHDDSSYPMEYRCPKRRFAQHSIGSLDPRSAVVGPAKPLFGPACPALGHEADRALASLLADGDVGNVVERLSLRWPAAVTQLHTYENQSRWRLTAEMGSKSWAANRASRDL
jgi:hypothetical protein